MPRQLTKKVKNTTARELTGWDAAIVDAENEILKAKQRIDALRLSVASFKEFKASNEPFPVVENKNDGQT
jgi:hypothetical protein